MFDMAIAKMNKRKEAQEQLKIDKNSFYTGEDELIDGEMFEKMKETILCPVCTNVYKNPVNVRLCLHKFCSDCIENYIRKYKKECP